MYFIARTCLLGTLIACLVVLPALGAPARPLAVVVASAHARVGGADAASGSTVFAGDALATLASGGLRLRVGTAQLYLLAESSATLREDSGIVDVALQRGGVRFASSAESPLVVRTPNALVRPATTKPTHSQVVLAGSNELLVSNFRGALEVVVGSEVYPVPEGTTYRVLLQPEPQEPSGTGGKAAAHHHAVMILVGVAIAAAVIAFAIAQNQSPSVP